MRKMRLDPESLVVEAFSTTGKLGGRGTVRGHDSTGNSWDDCSVVTCPGATTDVHTNMPGCGPIVTGYNIHSNTGCDGCVCPPLKTGTPGVC